MMQNPRHSCKWCQLKSHVSPLSSQKAHIFGKFELRKMEIPNFTANCAKSAQFANPHSESREISLIRANF